MKTKIFIYLERVGITNYRITEMVAQHNQGLFNSKLSDIAAAMRDMKSKYHNTLNKMVIQPVEDEGKINVYEDGKNLTYTVEEKEIYTIALIDKNNKGRHIAGEDALFLAEVPTYQRQKS